MVCDYTAPFTACGDALCVLTSFYHRQHELFFNNLCYCSSCQTSLVFSLHMHQWAQIIHEPVYRSAPWTTAFRNVPKDLLIWRCSDHSYHNLSSVKVVQIHMVAHFSNIDSVNRQFTYCLINVIQVLFTCQWFNVAAHSECWINIPLTELGEDSRTANKTLQYGLVNQNPALQVKAHREKHLSVLIYLMLIKSKSKPCLE